MRGCLRATTAFVSTALRRARAVWGSAGTYSWTCPQGVSQILFRGWGPGGGGGGGSGGFPGGGGGGGGYLEVLLDVAAGRVYSIVIGTGGTNSSSVTPTGFGGILLGIRRREWWQRWCWTKRHRGNCGQRCCAAVGGSVQSWNRNRASRLPRGQHQYRWCRRSKLWNVFKLSDNDRRNRFDRLLAWRWRFWRCSRKWRRWRQRPDDSRMVWQHGWVI